MVLTRPLEIALSRVADVAWHGFQTFNRHFPSKSFQPAWAPAPLLKSWERSSPVLGWPRTTDSLCPTCVRAARERILSGPIDVDRVVNDHTGEIKAQILERDGQIIIEQTCPQHCTFTDVLAINPAFLKRIERLFPGRDYFAVTDHLHDHGTSSIKYGRGSVLTVDLTNRCNMMCDPCFMAANQLRYVHDLPFADVN